MNEYNHKLGLRKRLFFLTVAAVATASSVSAFPYFQDAAGKRRAFEVASLLSKITLDSSIAHRFHWASMGRRLIFQNDVPPRIVEYLQVLSKSAVDDISEF